MKTRNWVSIALCVLTVSIASAATITLPEDPYPTSPDTRDGLVRGTWATWLSPYRWSYDDPAYAKPFDSDGDNKWGTAGYVMFADTAQPLGPLGVTPGESVTALTQNSVSLPSFVSGITYASDGAVVMNNASVYDSRTIVGATSESQLTEAGAFKLYSESMTAGTFDGYVYGNALTITIDEDAHFIMGVQLDYLAGTTYNGNTAERVILTDGTSSATSLGYGPGATNNISDAVPDMAFFDVNAQAGDTLTLKIGNNAAAETYFHGVTFDMVLPVTVTSAQISLPADEYPANGNTKDGLVRSTSETGWSPQRWSYADTNFAKPFDPDGDNKWGSSGYVMFANQNDFAMENVFPGQSVDTLINSATNSPGYLGDVNDVLLPYYVESIRFASSGRCQMPASVFDLRTDIGATSETNAVRAGEHLLLAAAMTETNGSYVYGDALKISINEDAQFILGVQMDFLVGTINDAYAGQRAILMSGTNSITSLGYGAAATGNITDGSPDMLFFEVTAKAGDTLTLKIGNRVEADPMLDTVYHGITFDSLETLIDGVPLGWIFQYYASTNEYLSVTDSDEDGLSNHDEYFADTIPTDSGSVLKVFSMDVGSSDVVINYQNGGPLSDVTLDYRYDLVLGDWQPLTTNVAPISTSNVYTNFGGAGDKGFYRLRAERP